MLDRALEKGKKGRLRYRVIINITNHKSLLDIKRLKQTVNSPALSDTLFCMLAGP
ncbi:hypothetical protein HanPI659440_Chr06g0246731 [Helianthus annuus]|nr:hypothetical protein HanHA300_Chr06g0222761 [Helianthus annuus]KAJ0574486.1 hypothetical protein HanHA89_Chr06g0238671 [Helianthus annuus]KAJ0738816.1 hypothetical protein HanLR1_Chr06g0222561 [Helianthus annuus]KAJ0741694.1 hypothetical protein HanOQP8_Chr06g0230941 [Helianthus annuus]KAJ0781212.1 hypothetical protein HanPI659440_Chr06g0246731 [Helianthus annuus]